MNTRWPSCSMTAWRRDTWVEASTKSALSVSRPTMIRGCAKTSVSSNSPLRKTNMCNTFDEGMGLSLAKNGDDDAVSKGTGFLYHAAHFHLLPLKDVDRSRA